MQEDKKRADALSLSVKEEQFRSIPSPPDPPIEPCKPRLMATYGDDGGAVSLELDTSGCSTILGWNLHRSAGAGLTRRLASLSAHAVYRERSLALDEEATYFAAALGPGGTEGEFSDPVSIHHVDTIPPDAPYDLQAAGEPGVITVSWQQPEDPSLTAYKIKVGTTSGGPYTLAVEALQERSSNRLEKSFAASGGQTYYVVISLRDHAGNEGPTSTEVVVEVP